MTPSDLLLDPEFSSLCWRHTEEEAGLLLASLRDEGCLQPICYWAIPDTPTEQCPILDGHTRYRLCRSNDIAYTTQAVALPDRQAALDWIVRRQLGRRNASEVQKSRLRGYLYLERKASGGNGRAPSDTVTPLFPNPVPDKGLDTQVVSGQPKPPKPPKRTKKGRTNLAEQIARETGVSTRQIHRDAAFAGAMEKLGEKSPMLRDAALDEQIGRSDAQVLAAASPEILKGIEDAPETDRRAAAKAAAQAMREKKRVAGYPVFSIRELHDLERAVGATIRAKSEALRACGGPKCAWAFAHHEKIREHLIAITDAVLAWQKEAQARATTT